MIESLGSGQLTSLLADVGLNIQEAHAFSSVDGFSLDVFVIDGWPYEVRSDLGILKFLRHLLSDQYLVVHKSNSF